MRRSSPIFLLICAILIAAFSGFSPFAVACVALSASVILLGEWMESRIIGISGFFILAFSASQTMDFPNLNVLFNIALTGLLFVLPLSFSLWFALTIESYFDEKIGRQFASYIWAGLFVALVLTSVPITGVVLHTGRFSGDIGIESQVMMIGFITAILAVAMLGVNERRRV